MKNYEPLNTLPGDIQQDWMATLQKASPTVKGVFRLVEAQRTKPKSYQEERIIVQVVDENGFPLPGIPVAFSYSTADGYVLTPDFLWGPPPPQKAFFAWTGGGCMIEQIQGGSVKKGEPGGVTVYLFDPEISCDVVTGCGSLADHTGLHLTFQLRRTDITPFTERVFRLEARVAALEAR